MDFMQQSNIDTMAAVQHQYVSIQQVKMLLSSFVFIVQEKEVPLRLCGGGSTPLHQFGL